MLQLDLGLHAILQDLASLASSFYPLNSYFGTYTCKQKHACNMIVQCGLSSFKTQNREHNNNHQVWGAQDLSIRQRVTVQQWSYSGLLRPIRDTNQVLSRLKAANQWPSRVSQQDSTNERDQKILGGCKRGMGRRSARGNLVGSNHY